MSTDWSLSDPELKETVMNYLTIHRAPYEWLKIRLDDTGVNQSFLAHWSTRNRFNTYFDVNTRQVRDGSNILCGGTTTLSTLNIVNIMILSSYVNWPDSADNLTKWSQKKHKILTGLLSVMCCNAVILHSVVW